MGRPIIVQVGLRATGTASLMEMLTLLGWSPLRNGEDERRLCQAVKENLPALHYSHPPHNAFCDGPYYEHLDKIAADYPSALCIYTPRDVEDYVASSINRRRLKADVPDGYDQDRRDYYEVNKQRVRAFAAEHRDRVLVLPLCHGAGWDLLCPFLGVDRSFAPLPRENVRRHEPCVQRRAGGFERFLSELD